MSVTHTHRLSVLSGAATILSAADTVTGDAEVVFNGSIPATTLYAANEIDVAFDKTKVKSLVIVADGALGLKTNADDGTADNTFALTANVPLVWKVDDLTAVPLAASVTKMYANNGLGVAVALKIYVLVDATP